jgi:hypothetical protein
VLKRLAADLEQRGLLILIISVMSFGFKLESDLSSTVGPDDENPGPSFDVERDVVEGPSAVLVSKRELVDLDSVWHVSALLLTMRRIFQMMWSTGC